MEQVQEQIEMIKNRFNQPVGFIKQDRNGGNIFVTNRRPEHFMKIYRGFGISTGILSYLSLRRVDRVLINYMRECGTIEQYVVPLHDFLISEKVWTHTVGGVDDPQKFVSIVHMESRGSVE